MPGSKLSIAALHLSTECMIIFECRGQKFDTQTDTQCTRKTPENDDAVFDKTLI